MLPRTRIDRVLAAGTAVCAVALVGLVAANRDAFAVKRYAVTTVARAGSTTTQGRAPVPAATPTPPRREAREAERADATPTRARPVVTITATRGPSWLEVRLGSRTGGQLHYGMLAEGQTVRFDRLPVWVRAGAIENVDVTLGGSRIRSLPTGGVAELVASAAGVAPAAG